jgi:hypothetical protein
MVEVAMKVNGRIFRKVITEGTAAEWVQLIAEELWPETAGEQPVVLLVDHVSGAAYFAPRVITIPLWACWGSPEDPKRERTVRQVFQDVDVNYLTYYVAHELAHFAAPLGSQHGPAFMEQLKAICPPHVIHHELRYKPRNAAAAGIREEG